MKTSCLAWALCSALIISPAHASATAAAPDPTYTGECDHDTEELSQHFTFWNGGRHGEDPFHCRYAVDALIFHQEAAYYMSWPKRCQKGTVLGFNGSQYMPHFSTLTTDAKMEEALANAVKALRGVSCSPTPQQQKELERQAQKHAQ